MSSIIRLDDSSDLMNIDASGGGVRLIYHGKNPEKVRTQLSGRIPHDRLITIKDIGFKELGDYAEAIINPPKCRPCFKRKLLAVVSPLPPLKTGIAYYTAELVSGLLKHYDVELITGQDTVSDIPEGCRVRSVSWFAEHFAEYDRVLYQMGNSGFHSHMPRLMRSCPGVAVLHDFYLGHFAAWMQYEESASDFLTEAVLFSHGSGGLRFLSEKGHEAVMAALPCSREFFTGSVGVVVHSEFAKSLAYKFYGQEFSDRIRVVPQTRRLPEHIDRQSARRKLNIPDDTFLVCSFGHVTAVKCGLRLAEVLKGISDIKAVFVGGFLDEDERDQAQEMQVFVTGSVDDETYGLYLQAADAAVQLRKGSRGETSRAVLDCMAYGVAVIVNDDGAMAELPEDCVFMLKGDFSDEMLSEAVCRLKNDAQLRRRLGENGRAYAAGYSPENAAGILSSEIESLYTYDSETCYNDFLSNISDRIRTADDSKLEALAKAVVHCKSVIGRRNIYIDISVVVHTDHRTGIQRVVRSILQSFAADFVSGFRVMPVYISSAGGRRCYRKAPEYLLNFSEEFDSKPFLKELTDIEESGDIIEPCQNDIFLGADFDSVKVYEAYRDGLFKEWRERGARIHFIVYDLLPVKFPQFFPHYAFSGHADWLYAVGRSAHTLLCISKAVADELEQWFDDNMDAQRAAVDWFHLGADIESSLPTKGLPQDANDFLKGCRGTTTFLMVGTVEPRKGHYQTVKAFDVLLDSGADVRLVVAGCFGWLADEAVRAMRHSRHFGRGIFWIENASDEYLKELYGVSACIISASFGEGFGLPLIEAAQKGKPLLVRDIPVFREVAGENAFYFSDITAAGLADRISQWLRLYAEKVHPESSGIRYLSWRESAAVLFEKITRENGVDRVLIK